MYVVSAIFDYLYDVIMRASNHCTSVQYVYMYFHSHLHSASRDCTQVSPRYNHTLVLPTQSITWLWFCSFCSCLPCTAQGLHTEVNLHPLRHQRQLPVLVQARGTVGRKPRMRLRLNNSATWSTTLPLTMSPLKRPC